MLVRSQGDELIDVLGDIAADVPLPILGEDRGAAEEDLEALVLNQTRVHGAGGITGLVQGGGVDDIVLRILQVEVDVTIEAVVEHLELGTDLIGGEWN